MDPDKEVDISSENVRKDVLSSRGTASPNGSSMSLACESETLAPDVVTLPFKLLNGEKVPSAKSIDNEVTSVGSTAGVLPKSQGSNNMQDISSFRGYGFTAPHEEVEDYEEGSRSPVFHPPDIISFVGAELDGSAAEEAFGRDILELHNGDQFRETGEVDQSICLYQETAALTDKVSSNDARSFNKDHPTELDPEIFPLDDPESILSPLPSLEKMASLSKEKVLPREEHDHSFSGDSESFSDAGEISSQVENYSVSHGPSDELHDSVYTTVAYVSTSDETCTTSNKSTRRLNFTRSSESSVSACSSEIEEEGASHTIGKDSDIIKSESSGDCTVPVAGDSINEDVERKPSAFSSFNDETFSTTTAADRLSSSSGSSITNGSSSSSTGEKLTNSRNANISTSEENKEKKCDLKHLTTKSTTTSYSSSKTRDGPLPPYINSSTPNTVSCTVNPLSSARTSAPFLNVSSASSSSSSTNEVPQNIALSPPLSSNINLPITQLGKVAPTWLPDSETAKCMQCDVVFSFTRRRHHCRACGKIFCSSCSNLKTTLQYLDNKDSRVCSKCYQDLIRAQYYQHTHRKSQTRPNPNNPSEYCSVVSPLLQVQSLTPVPLPSIMVPTTGVLRKQGSVKGRPEGKQVMFADGIRPGGDLTEVDGISSLRLNSGLAGRRTKRVEKPGKNNVTPGEPNKCLVSTKQNTCLIPVVGGLPPVVVTLSSSSSSSPKGFSLMDSPTTEFVLYHLFNGDHPRTVTFVIDKFLAVIVQIVHLNCCMHRLCWSFATKGMRNVGQDEIVILLECLPDEQTVPMDVFHHLHHIYQHAGEGTPVLPMGHTVLPHRVFGGMDRGGFLFVRHTFQCLEKLNLPEPPYLFGILLQKWEISWARVFPLRLLLRLGAEFRYYPCPLISVRNRRPVYGEIGHTIMNLLADFHNFQYAVPQISGLVIHLEDRRITVQIPSSRYDAVMKVLNSANDHVLALGADFSTAADSYLVAIQNDDGNYQTQAINIQNKACKVTGASFVVFNGALKPASGLTAKSSVIEDGVMVQVTSSTMAEIKQAWKDMKNYTIYCNNLTMDDVVMIEWIDDQDSLTINSNVKSPVDGLSLQGKENRRIHNATDFTYDDHIVRWTEIFLLGNEQNESTNVNRLIDSLAQAACIVLVSHSPLLTGNLMTKIGIRITVSSAEVSIRAGSKEKPLPDVCLFDLEEKLMPLMQKYSFSIPSLASSSSSSSLNQGTLVVELIFHLLHLSCTIASTPSISMPD